MDSPYTKYRPAQYRGPSTSDGYNERIEENYKDLVLLVNRARLSEVEKDELFRRIAKELIDITRVTLDLEERVTALEYAETMFSFYSESQIDTNRFNAV